MKAIVLNQQGGPETLEMHERPDLQPVPGMLTLDVAYAGVGYADVMIRRGKFGPLSGPVVPGLEVSGYVRALGEGVEGFSIGQPVASMTLLDLGGYASQAHVNPALTVALDQLGAELDLVSAAASIVNVTTAYLAIKRVARMQRGDRILVHAAAGGLGVFLGQLARYLGAGRVLGTVGSVEKVKRAASFGYDEIFARSSFVKQTLQATEQKGVQIIFDPVGGAVRQQSLQALCPLGQLVALGNASGEPDILRDLWLSDKAVAGFALGAYARTAPEEVGKAAKEALHLLAKKEIHAEVFGVYSLRQASAVHDLLESKQTVGKAVLDMIM